MDHVAGTPETAYTDNTLAGGGEMGQRMREHDWSTTLVGPVSSWPQSLRTAVSICLASRFPIIIFWGPDLVQFYNDAYRPILGMTKHPQALGQEAKDCWPEVWDVIGPMLQGVLSSGEATWSENQLLLLDRNGYVEECYFTFSYSPIRDETGGVGGVFCAVTETTGEVLAERRLHPLSDVAAKTAEITTAKDICLAASQVLAHNPDDLPFTLLYLLNSKDVTAYLAGTSGAVPSSHAHPEYIQLDDPHQLWPFATVSESGQNELVHNLQARFGEPGGDHQTFIPVAQSAQVLPLLRPGQATPYGFLVAGISVRRALDESYQQFLSLLAGQITTALANARSYQEARERADALIELDRAKTVFFSNISHEFRTPLTLLIGPVETLLLDDASLTPAQREALEIARRNALRLLKLVNALLDFSRIEAGRTNAVYEPTDLAVLTADLASSFRSAIEQAGLQFTVETPSLSEPIYVDHDMWEKIVLNLLSNAFKFTLEGQIRVMLSQTEHSVTLIVQDTGTGIEADALPHLFERFYRVRGTQSRTYEGTGIGLALVQELVQLHGGTIEIQSKVGDSLHGTTVTITLPKGIAHLPTDHIHGTHTPSSTTIAAAPYVEEALRWLQPSQPDIQTVSDEHAWSPTLELSSLGLETTSSASILVVDDNADMRDYIMHLLQPLYTVRTATDGLAALTMIRNQRPDLIISDIMMPVMDGVEFLRTLRSDLQLTIPVILLSARAGEEATIEGLQAGANDYLVKPFSARELLATVKARLEIARVHEEALAEEREQSAQLQQLAEERTLLYQQAQEATQQRDELLAMVSHDLKNPLGAIKGYSQILRRTLVNSPANIEERVQTSLERIEATTNRMTSLINELLDLSHLYRGQVLELIQEPVDLVALLHAVVTEQQHIAQKHQITVESSVESLMMMGDSARLDRVFSNLISNAIKYDADDMPITVSLSRSETENGPIATVEVRDQGIGIPALELPHVFEPFRRASNVVGKIRGTGVGLASARQIVERHGGSIDVQSTQGVGSTFIVRLPIAD